LLHARLLVKDGLFLLNTFALDPSSFWTGQNPDKEIVWLIALVLGVGLPASNRTRFLIFQFELDEIRH